MRLFLPRPVQTEVWAGPASFFLPWHPAWAITREAVPAGLGVTEGGWTARERHVELPPDAPGASFLEELVLSGRGGLSLGHHLPGAN